MDNYNIRHPFVGVPLENGILELQITSENLIYTEIGYGHGLQCMNNDNHSEILKKCSEVANLIREIDELNAV